MINIETAWKLVRQNAIKALQAKIEWHSIPMAKPYTLKKVLSNHLIIERRGGGANQKLTSFKVAKAIEQFNKSNCKVKRRHLISPTVAEETALVLFHPKLTWSDSGEFIIQINSKKN